MRGGAANHDPEVPWDTEGLVPVSISYTDLAGEQATRTRIELRTDDGAFWWVHRVQHAFNEEAMPLFEVDPMNNRC